MRWCRGAAPRSATALPGAAVLPALFLAEVSPSPVALPLVAVLLLAVLLLALPLLALPLLALLPVAPPLAGRWRLM